MPWHATLKQRAAPKRLFAALRMTGTLDMTDWREKEAKYFMRTGRRMDIVAVRGQGTTIWDEQGRSTSTSSAGRRR